MAKAFDLIFITVIALITSFVGMACELLVARFLSGISQDSILSQSLTIGTYLAGLGIGSFLASQFVSQKKAALYLILTETILSFSIAISLLTILFLHLWWFNSGHAFGWSPKLSFIASSELVTAFLGVLAGFEIPLLLLLMPRIQKSFGFILGMSYLGGLVGNLTLFWWIIPRFGLLQSALFLACLTSIGAALVYLRYFVLKPNWSFCLIFLALMFPPFLVNWTPAIEQFYLKSFYYTAPAAWNLNEIANTYLYQKNFPDVKRISSPYQEIDLVLNEEHGKLIPDEFYLFIDQRLQNSPQNVPIYHDLMAHASFNLAKSQPKKILILGGGDGILLNQILKYQFVQEVTVVELDPMIIHLAKENSHFLRLNENSFANKKSKIIIADGFEWIRNSRDFYDAILIDLPLPHSPEISRLYSVEFYRFLFSRLSPQGFVVFDYPFFPILNLPHQDDASLQHAASVIKSVKEAGFVDYKIFGFTESFLIAFPRKHSIEFDYEKLSPLIHDISVTQMSFVNPEIFEKLETGPNSLFVPRILPPPTENSRNSRQ